MQIGQKGLPRIRILSFIFEAMKDTRWVELSLKIPEVPDLTDVHAAPFPHQQGPL